MIGPHVHMGPIKNTSNLETAHTQLLVVVVMMATVSKKCEFDDRIEWYRNTNTQREIQMYGRKGTLRWNKSPPG